MSCTSGFVADATFSHSDPLILDSICNNFVDFFVDLLQLISIPVHCLVPIMMTKSLLLLYDRSTNRSTYMFARRPFIRLPVVTDTVVRRHNGAERHGRCVRHAS